MRWLKKRAVVHAVIVALFVAPMLGLLSVPSDQDKVLISMIKRQFDSWEDAAIDSRIRLGRTAPVHPEIVFLAIDSPSMSISTVLDEQTIAASHPLSLMRSFPYPRDVYPLICDKLFAAGAKVVAFDLFFPAPKPEDTSFRAAIDRYRNQFVLGMNFTDGSLLEDPVSLDLPTSSLFPDQSNLMDPLLGYLNFWPDEDDVVRRAQYRTNPEKLKRQKGAEQLPAYHSLAARMVEKAGHGKLIPDDLDARPIRFAGPPLRSFRHDSLYEIFDSHAWEATFNKGEYFRGKIVLIGPQGDLAKDKLRTPYGLMDGAEIHLNAMNALLQNEFLQRFSDRATVGFVLASGLIAYLLAMGIASIAWRFAAVLLVLGGYMLAGIWVYNGPGLLLPAIAPMGLLGGMTGVGFIYDFVLSQLERLRLRTTFERYTSPNVAKYLLDNSASYQEMLGGKRKPVTALFSDVRGFTTMTEKADSQELVTKLNEYLTAMVDCVFRHDGSLDKFIGDAVMAVWGNTPYNFGPKEDAIRAVRAALAMMKELHVLNAKWLKEGRTEWHIGIGLNHGEVIVGDMGSPQRKEFAVIGDAINLASRLESLTKEYHVDILIGESVADLVRDQFRLRTVDLVQVKGKTEAVQTFTVLGEKSESLTPVQEQFLAAYEEAIVAFRGRRFSQARDLFAQALKLQPGDHLTTEYHASCEAFIQTPPDESWTGVRVMTKK